MPPPVTIERLRLSDEKDFLAAVHASRQFHHPWVKPPADKSGFAEYLARAGAEDYVAWVIRTQNSGSFVGVCNLSQVFRRSFQNAYLGYWANAEYAGRGLMKAGLRLVLDHAFGPFALHRLEANVQPQNTASIALIRRLGFRKEGFSPRYLKIGGAWRDHERWAITTEEWPLIR